jgi:hypothetical protein
MMKMWGIMKSGGEGGLKPQAFGNPHFTRQNVAIAFTTASFQIERVKRREVLRSAKKPKKWRKTVARSSPSGKFSFFDSAGRRELREPQCAM